MMPIKLIIGHADGRVEMHSLADGSYTIGRDAADIVLADPSFTVRCVLQISAGTATVRSQSQADAGGALWSQPLRVGEPLRLGASSVTLSPPQTAHTDVMPAVTAAAVESPLSVADRPPAPRQRGTLIKLPDASPGLLILGGQQKQFVLESVWRVAAPPVLGMQVEVELDPEGRVSGVFGVDAQQVMREHGQQVASVARSAFGTATSRIGTLSLVALVVLWIGWFFAPAISYGPMSLTLWDVLGLDPDNLFGMMLGQRSHGLLSVLALTALVAPLGVLFLKGSRTGLLNAAPLAFLSLLVLTFGWGVHSAVSQTKQMTSGVARMLGGAEAAKGAEDLQNSALALAFGVFKEAAGFGLLLVFAASVVLFVQAFRSQPALGAGFSSALHNVGNSLSGIGGIARDQLVASVDPNAQRKRRLLIAAGAGTALLLAGGLVVLFYPKNPAERLLDVTDEMASIISSNQDDCAALGRELKEFAEEHRDDYQEFASLSPEQHRELTSRHGAELEAQGKRLRELEPIFRRCMRDPTFQEAVATMGQNLPTAGSPVGLPSRASLFQRQQADDSGNAAQNAALLRQQETLQAELRRQQEALQAAKRAAAAVPAPAPAPPPPAADPAAQPLAAQAALAPPSPPAPVAAPAPKPALLAEGCGDARLGARIDSFIELVRRGSSQSLPSLASPVNGLLVRHDIESPNVRIPVQSLPSLFTSPAAQRYSAPGSPPVVGPFKDVLLPALLQTVSADVRRTCGQVALPAGSPARKPWPPEFSALIPYTIAPAQSASERSTWVLGLEYSNNVPYLSTLIQYAPPKSEPPQAKPLASPKAEAKPRPDPAAEAKKAEEAEAEAKRERRERRKREREKAAAGR